MMQLCTVDFLTPSTYYREQWHRSKETRSSKFIYILIWKNDNPLYTTGQIWLGIAVSIGYSYFGLNGKKETAKNDNDQMNNDADAAQNVTYGGDDNTNADGGEDVKFANEKGKILPTTDDLKSKLVEVQEKVNAALDREDVAAVVKFRKEVVELKKKLAEEE